MDRLDSASLFVLNMMMALILATNFFGIQALIAFGLVAAGLGLMTVVLLFADSAFNFAPKFAYVRTKLPNFHK